MLKKITSLFLAIAIMSTMVFVLAACDNNANENEYSMYLEYPSDMQELGYTEAMGFDSIPERAVVLTAGPELALYELGVGIVGYYLSTVVDTPQEIVDNATAFGDMSSTFDTEAVVVLNPDLIVMLYTYQDTYGVIFESMNLNVYYVSGAHGIGYDSVKLQTQSFIDAFDTEDGKIGDEIMGRFTAVEDRMEAVGDKYEDVEILVFMSAYWSNLAYHFVQTSNGSLRNMFDMIGFTTIGAEGVDSAGMVSLDKEYALANWSPDYIFFATMGNDMDEAAAELENLTACSDSEKAFWDEFTADMSGEIVGLPVTYCSAGGIGIIDAINDLMDYMEELLGY